MTKLTITILVTYYLDVTIVNRYGKLVRVETTDPTYQRFVIPVGGRYQIKSTSSASETIIITAYDGDTPIMIDGKNSLTVSNSIEPMAFTYYIPSGKQRTTSLPPPVTGIGKILPYSYILFF